MGNINIKDVFNDEVHLHSLIDFIAAKYITQQSFKDMMDISNPEHCDKVIIMTSDTIYNDIDQKIIEYVSHRIDGKSKRMRDNLFMFNPDKIRKYDVKDNTIKRSMCLGIAKFYVKIAQVFAAITTTVRPYSEIDVDPIILPSETIQDPYKSKKGTDVSKIRNSLSRESREKLITPMKIEPIPNPSVEQIPYESKSFITPEEVLFERNKEMNDPLKPSSEENETMDRIHRYSSLCGSRISELEDMVRKEGNFFNIESKFCNGSRKDILGYEPGIPELDILYYDIYDYTSGKFTGKSRKSTEQYNKHLNDFYKEFTGSNVMNKRITRFSDISIYQYDKECDGKYSKSYKTGDESLFVQYAKHLKKMIKTSTEKQKKLVNIINVCRKSRYT
jgi:hypothetical protein